MVVGAVTSYFVGDGGGVVQFAGTSRQLREHLGIALVSLGGVETPTTPIHVRVLQHLVTHHTHTRLTALCPGLPG